MDEMLTKASYRQPTLTQMDFVDSKRPAPKPLPKGWQRHTDEETGKLFFVHVSTGRIVYKFKEVFKKIRRSKPVTPSRVDLPVSAPEPDHPISGINMFSTPRRHRFGSASQPIDLEADEGSDAFSDLSSSAFSPIFKKKDIKKVIRNRKRVYRAVEEEGPVLGEEGPVEVGSESESESDSDRSDRSPNLSNPDRSRSPNLLE
jgi:hypothetical protein